MFPSFPSAPSAREPGQNTADIMLSLKNVTFPGSGCVWPPADYPEHCYPYPESAAAGLCSAAEPGTMSLNLSMNMTMEGMHTHQPIYSVHQHWEHQTVPEYQHHLLQGNKLISRRHSFILSKKTK